MAEVNLILQGKGGAGKSFIATLLAQHYKKVNGVDPVCIDTDPVNPTFSGFKAFNARRLDLMSKSRINPIGFDEFVKTVMEADPESVVIVDNGAPTFVPLCGYLISCGTIPFLREAGHEVRFHSVVTGGDGQDHTVEGLNTLCSRFPDVDVVVWLNEYFGEIRNSEGKPFKDFKVYRKWAKLIVGTVTLPVADFDLFGYDIRRMLKARLTFAEAIASPEFDIVASQRLVMYRREVEEAMEALELATGAKKPLAGKDGNGKAAAAGSGAKATPVKGNGAQAPGQDQAQEDRGRAAQAPAATDAASPAPEVGS